MAFTPHLRIREVHIHHWRNLCDLHIVVPAEATLVCLVGANGTGKSSILELLSAVANKLGISAGGVDLARGNPLTEPHHVTVKVQVTRESSSFLDELPLEVRSAYEAWDGTIVMESRNDGNAVAQPLHAGEIEHSVSVAQTATAKLRELQDVHFVYLDADRAYPPLGMNANLYAAALQRDWDSQQERRQRGLRQTRTLYEEWMQAFLAREGRYATQYAERAREALRKGEVQPAFEEKLAGYANMLNEVLPHLHFSGVDLEAFTVLFDSSGTKLSFHQLSGGEREIAFLAGQIEFFGLKRGLLLIDEPELHLNSDLLRTWMEFLRNSIDDGQVWIATHSLEAVEVAGLINSFVLDREEHSREVRSATSLHEKPAMTVLSAALGSPAFASTRLRFVFVEGERQKGERQRFHELNGDPSGVRFLEAGDCRAVQRKMHAVREVAEEAEQGLRIGGIVDRDHLSDAQAAAISAEGVHVLGCHEIENVYLSPPLLGALFEQANRTADEAFRELQRASDREAGRWVWEEASARLRETSDGRSGWDASKAVRAAVLPCDCAGLESVIDALDRDGIEDLADDEAGIAVRTLKSAYATYTLLRADHERLWQECHGKEVVKRLATVLGLQNDEQLEQRARKLFSEGGTPLPAALEELRAYVSGLPTVSSI